MHILVYSFHARALISPIVIVIIPHAIFFQYIMIYALSSIDVVALAILCGGRLSKKLNPPNSS
jgi:hypothetical protein